MNRNPKRWLIAALLLLIGVMTVYAGGPPIITIERLPDYFVVGKPETFKFVVRAICCDHVPLEAQSYTVRARADRRPEIRTLALPTGKAGQYAAMLTLPHAGEWTISVEIWTDAPLLPIKAIPPGAAPPPPLSQVARGERFFIEKGCVSCHINRELTAPAFPAYWNHARTRDVSAEPGLTPDLTGRKYPADYLRKLLANPADTKKGAEMPNLELSFDDISSLIAFINRDRPATVSNVKP